MNNVFRGRYVQEKKDTMRIPKDNISPVLLVSVCSKGSEDVDGRAQENIVARAARGRGVVNRLAPSMFGLLILYELPAASV